MKVKIYEYQDNGATYFKETAIYGVGGGLELEVELPDFLNPYETENGEVVIEPENSFPQFLTDCLCENNGKPCICVTYGKNIPISRYYNLKVYSRQWKDLARFL